MYNQCNREEKEAKIPSRAACVQKDTEQHYKIPREFSIKIRASLDRSSQLPALGLKNSVKTGWMLPRTDGGGGRQEEAARAEFERKRETAGPVPPPACARAPRGVTGSPYTIIILIFSRSLVFLVLASRPAATASERRSEKNTRVHTRGKPRARKARGRERER